jgi:hypothetical protein
MSLDNLLVLAEARLSVLKAVSTLSPQLAEELLMSIAVDIEKTIPPEDKPPKKYVPFDQPLPAPRENKLESPVQKAKLEEVLRDTNGTPKKELEDKVPLDPLPKKKGAKTEKLLAFVKLKGSVTKEALVRHMLGPEPKPNEKNALDTTLYVLRHSGRLKRGSDLLFRLGP